MALPRLSVPVLAFAAVAAFAPQTGAQAATAYDSGVGAADATYLEPSYTGPVGDPIDDYELADDIILGSDYDIGSATFLGSSTDAAPFSFDIAFYAVDGAAPATSPTASRTGVAYSTFDTGETLNGRALQSYTIAFDVISLTAGNWWVSIVANAQGDDKWHWAGVYQNTSSMRFREAGGGGAWGTYTPLDMALTLDAGASGTPVPAPAALPLLAAGLAGFALVGRRRRA
ncbi:PEP-CTERM sorting domain-containing protein [Albimonas pacifica]|uniref:VPLPA-CTERM protein sorting domain-containing protein n=1 Tax=Albimonas pacifica TaxID=1114924 RepID=A0A1I3KT61_9RHOB|nr:PEP-CTERM sorting domain-containing protein [Albimonas pacifica]SFI75683.1 VPLPA-CTERM protein sorting domain-containing protein [Albimonas pacifica]